MSQPMIWSFVNDKLCVLIPKKRGSGYLRYPYGHHQDPVLEAIRSELGDVDIFGLDGHLEFDRDLSGDPQNREAFASKAIGLLEAHYGVESYQSDQDFWLNHPS